MPGVWVREGFSAGRREANCQLETIYLRPKPPFNTTYAHPSAPCPFQPFLVVKNRHSKARKNL